MQNPLDTASREIYPPGQPDPYQMGAPQEKSNPVPSEESKQLPSPDQRAVLLLVKDVPADPGKRPLASRPVGLDVSRMKEHCALQHRCLPLIVDRFGHFPGAQPVLPRRGRQRVELRP